MATVHDNQIVCGKSIIKEFDNDKYHLLLLAQMQMGKSGTYWYVIYNMLFGTGNTVDNVLVLSGNRETELHQQVYQDKQEYKKWYFSQPEVVEGRTKDEIKTMKKSCAEKITILWGTQLSNTDYKVKENTLIVWDEAHYAQSEDNTPDRFFKNQNLESLINSSVSLDDARKNNVKVLSVSATPFSQLTVNCDNNDDSSIFKCMRLEPSPNYYGVKYYRDNNRIHKSFLLDYGHTESFTQLIDKYTSFEDPKFMIIRANNKDSYNIVLDVCNEREIECLIYDSTHKGMDINILKNKPKKPTVVLITGMLRMGKVLHKQHINMVFESATKNKSSRKTDTGLQGLLGRVCGYSTNGFNIHVYVDPSLMIQVDQYIESYDSNHGPITTKAMNTRAKPPVKKTKRCYNIVQIPFNENFLTKKGNLVKKNVVDWLLINQTTLEGLNDSQCNELNLAIHDTTRFVMKNITLQSNSSLRKMINNGSKECYLTLEHNKIYIVNEIDNVYIIIRDMTNEVPPDQEGVDHTKELYVLDKCVFKPSRFNCLE